jgi:hypothetical protein
MRSKAISTNLTIILVLFLAACAPGAGGPGPRTWIDDPLDSSTVALGPVVVRSHAASDGGTAQAALLVNGAQVRVDLAGDPSSPLIEFAQTWAPEQPGVYVLQVISTDINGNEGRSNSVRVQVGEVPIVETGTPVPGAATLTPAITVVSAPTFTFGQNANCRKGDSTAYEVVTSFLAGQQVAIQGRNSDNTWFWVLIPNGGGNCWVSGSTGIPTGPYTTTQVVNPPPLPAPSLANPPNAPGQFNVNTKSCTTSEYIVRLKWNDSNEETGYRVYRDGNLIATISADSTIYDDSSPDYNSHSYQVQAYNDAGTAGSSTKNSEGCLY